MGKTRNRMYSRGIGRNPAGLGLKWETKTLESKMTPFGLLEVHGRKFMLTIKVSGKSKRITIDKDVAQKLIDEYDKKREEEYNHNMGGKE